MNKLMIRAAVVPVAMLAAVALQGCGSSSPTMSAEGHAQDLAAEQARIADLQKQIKDQDVALKQAEAATARALADAQQAKADAAATGQPGSMSGSGSASLLPPSAKVGECYARVLVPPVYESYTEEVKVRDEGTKLAVSPAAYDWAEEKVLVKEASSKLEVVPAKYEWVEEKVMTKPARKELRIVPAQYTTETEKILVAPARTYWKTGRGLVEKVDNNTGEIMCLVEEPAQYKTVTKTILVKAESVEEVVTPAEYSTVKRMVEASPATTRTIEIPAEYKTVKVLQQTKPAAETQTSVPAEYRTVTKQKMVSASTMEWRPVICETNITGSFVLGLQKALDAKGFSPGPIDGVYGAQTQAAVRAFQKANGMATGGLTYNTVKALGLSS